MSGKSSAKLKEEIKRVRANARNRAKKLKDDAKAKAKRAKDKAAKDTADQMAMARRVAAPVAGIAGGLLGSVIRNRSETADALDEDWKRWVPRIVNYGVGDVAMQLIPLGSVNDLGVGMGAYQAGVDLDNMRLTNQLTAGASTVPAGETETVPAVGDHELDAAVQKLELGQGNPLGVLEVGALPAKPLGVLEEGQVQLQALEKGGVWDNLSPIAGLGDIEYRNPKSARSY